MKDVTLRTWLLTVALALVMLAFASWIFGAFDAQEEIHYTVEAFCNSFFLVGFLMIGLGGLIWCASQGIFNGLTYSFTLIFQRRSSAFERRKSYREYCQEKAKKKPVFVHMLIIGGVLVFISIVLLVIHAHIAPTT